MLLSLLLLLQASSAAPEAAIDLTASDPCRDRRAAEADVVVCGRKEERSPYRLPILPKVEEKQVKAEKLLGGGAAVAAETEQVDVGGFPSNRLMVRFKVKF